jgi:hypothetical protein
MSNEYLSMEGIRCDLVLAARYKIHWLGSCVKHLRRGLQLEKESYRWINGDDD